MKRFVLAFLAALMLLALVSCATGTDITQKNRDGSPIWTTEIPSSNRYLYGVGKAKLLGESSSQMAADANARLDLARQIRVNLKENLSSYYSESGASTMEAMEQVMVQTVDLAMNKVVVEQRWTAKDGTVWSLVSFKSKDLPALYKDAANK
ncbi:MAG: LPP20 family lipoprotein [Sphaerochaetaceae bacterium]|nr:LPP20 family lipoprotein [Sphaerochaetaceae bacterium]